MRVFVLGLDGLEYDLVVKWQLRHLMQKTYGKFEIGEKYFIWKDGIGGPYSPLVWASFITGEPPSVHGISGFWTYRNRLLDFTRKLPFIAKFQGKRRYLSKLGIKPTMEKRQDLKVKTIFDAVQPSIAIDVVGYNPMETLRRKQFKAKNIDEFMHIAFNNFKRKKEILFSKLNSNWKLFMFYVSLTDHAGHCWTFNRLRKVYQAMDALVTEIKNSIDNCIFLIVSDHGMTEHRGREEYGTRLHVHSKYAFYSLNIKTKWQPNIITDFYDTITKWTKL